MKTQNTARLSKRILLLITTVVFSSVAAEETASLEQIRNFVRDLPTELGEFSKGKTHQYEEAELGASAAYYMQRTTATIYAFGPGRNPETGDEQVQEARDQTKSELQRFDQWGKIRHLGDDEVAIGAEPRQITFLRSSFSFQSQDGELLSYSYITQLDDHLLKVRMTCPGRPKGVCSETAGRFVEALAEYLSK